MKRLDGKLQLLLPEETKGYARIEGCSMKYWPFFRAVRIYFCLLK